MDGPLGQGRADAAAAVRLLDVGGDAGVAHEDGHRAADQVLDVVDRGDVAVQRLAAHRQLVALAREDGVLAADRVPGHAHAGLLLADRLRLGEVQRALADDGQQGQQQGHEGRDHDQADLGGDVGAHGG